MHLGSKNQAGMGDDIMIRFGAISWDYKDTSGAFSAASAHSEKEWKAMANDVLCAKSHIVLVTCNRAELYFTYDDSKMPHGSIREMFPDALLDMPAATHLFRVSAGLESMSIGENEIMHQVKAAYDRHKAAGEVDTLMSNIFTHAISFGKCVRKGTHISKGKTSIPSIAIDMASQLVNLEDSSVCVIGTGKMAETFLRYFKKRGCKKTFVVGRNVDAGNGLASAYSAVFKEIHALRSVLAEADVFFVATNANDFIIKKDMVSGLKNGRLFVDISNPRNVDPEIAGMHGFKLIGFEELESIAKKSAIAKKRDILEAEEMLTAKLGRLELNIMESPADEILSKSYTFVESVASSGAKRLLKELKNGKNESEASRNMARAVAKKILNKYAVAVKDATTKSNEELLGQLTGLFDDQ